MIHDVPPPPPGSGTLARLLVLGLLVCYGLAALAGLPQRGRDLLVAAQAAHGVDHAADHDSDPAADHAAAADPHVAPPAALVIPFATLLAAIAIFPLTPAVAHWWEHNSSKLLVAGGLALVTLAYYTFFHRHPVELHFPAHALVPAAATGPSWGVTGAVLTNALCAEYVPFIMLLFALYVITGGVRLEGDLEATPTVNTTFIAAGALAASFIGTTGAAMLLVRPLLETNLQRKRVAHTLVFFIFAACNCGGCLLPIGDPPLFRASGTFSKLRQNVGVEQPGQDEIFLGMSRWGAKSASSPASGIRAKNDLNNRRVTSEPRVSRRISRCSASADLPCRAARLRSA